MVKLILLVLIIAILVALLSNLTTVVNMIGTFTSTITTPVSVVVSVVKEFFDILLSNYYCLLVFSVLVIACVIGFVLSWLTGKGD